MKRAHPGPASGLCVCPFRLWAAATGLAEGEPFAFPVARKVPTVFALLSAAPEGLSLTRGSPSSHRGTAVGPLGRPGLWGARTGQPRGPGAGADPRLQPLLTPPPGARSAPSPARAAAAAWPATGVAVTCPPSPWCFHGCICCRAPVFPRTGRPRGGFAPFSHGAGHSSGDGRTPARRLRRRSLQPPRPSR